MTQIITFFIHDDYSVELVIDGQHALLSPQIVEEIFKALDEKASQSEDEENDEEEKIQ